MNKLILTFLLLIKVQFSFAQEKHVKLDNKDFILNDSVSVEMPDGGTIAMTILRDASITARQPAVLVYNIYSGNDTKRVEAAARKGYVSIVANPRGIRMGHEAIRPFEKEANDIYHIIDWISKQPWSNGKVGMYGASYLGFSQWAGSKMMHPALKTIVPMVAVAPGVDFPLQNGIVANFTLSWLHFVTDANLPDYKSFSDQEKWNKLLTQWYSIGSSYRSLDSLEGRPFPIFQRWLQHPGNDTFWRQMIPQKNEYDKINIPILTIAGYYDYDQIGTLHYFRELQKWNKNNDSYLIIGPYDHSGGQGNISKNLRGYEIDSVANVDLISIVFEYLDYVLKDEPKPSFLKNKINFQLMGSNKWHHVASLNKMYNDSIRFYLGTKKKDNYYSLISNKPTKSSFISQTVDLKDRSELAFSVTAIPDITKIEDTALHPQKEQLVFISDPINEPYAISGAITASLSASINKKDMDVMFTLYELTPDGKYVALTANRQRASYAKNDNKRNLLTPNTKQTIAMNNTYLTSRQLKKGSRIVLVMGMNKNPNWQINYGTGKDVNDETMFDASIPYQIKWYNESFITIPVLRGG